MMPAKLPFHKRSLHPWRSRHNPIWYWLKLLCALIAIAGIIAAGMWAISVVEARDMAAQDRDALLECLSGTGVLKYSAEDGSAEYIHCMTTSLELGKI